MQKYRKCTQKDTLNVLGNTQSVEGIRKMYRKICTKYKTCIKKKKGIDNGIEQSDYTIISSRVDSICAPRGAENCEIFFEE